MKLKAIILPLLALALTSCSTSSSFSSSLPEREIEKTNFNDNINIYNNNSIYLTDTIPNKGTKALIIPVWFTDSNLYIKDKYQIANEINKVFFGSKSDVGWRSVKGYYEEESHGNFILQGSVAPWYECRLSSQYVDSTAKTTALVKAAVNNFKNSVSEEEYRSYDTDKDGFIDAVALIYGAKHKQQASDNENLWAYTFWVQDLPGSMPVPNTYLWASYDFMYNDTRHCKLDAHTYIHEFGHMLGLEDYYDYNPKKGYEPAGQFSMQDYNVGGHEPYSTMAIGWTSPYIPKESMRIKLKPFSASGEFILLANHNVISPFDEYMLLEFYTPTGLNELDSSYRYSNSYPIGPKKAGIRLWHVDARLIAPYGIGRDGALYREKDIVNSVTIKGSYGLSQLLTNTSYSEDFAKDNSEYLSKLGGKYYDYRLLELIRNNDTSRKNKNNPLSENDLFTQGSHFAQGIYSSYFVNGEYMNDTLQGNKPLNWEFYVDEINNDFATLSLIKI